jgi:hypothetical protein
MSTTAQVVTNIAFAFAMRITPTVRRILGSFGDLGNSARSATHPGLKRSRCNGPLGQVNLISSLGAVANFVAACRANHSRYCNTEPIEARDAAKNSGDGSSNALLISAWQNKSMKVLVEYLEQALRKVSRASPRSRAYFENFLRTGDSQDFRRSQTLPP